jgi:hypothetical protein
MICTSSFMVTVRTLVSLVTLCTSVVLMAFSCSLLVVKVYGLVVSDASHCASQRLPGALLRSLVRKVKVLFLS